VSSAVLNDTVSLAKVDLLGVEFEPDLPRQHADEIDTGGAVHAPLVRLHVGRSTGKQLFELALSLGRECTGSLRLLRRNREEVETNAAGRREVCDGTFDLCAWRVGRCVIKAPEAMPYVSGKRRYRHGLNEIISGHVGNAIGRARDDAPYGSLAHGSDVIRRQSLPLVISTPFGLTASSRSDGSLALVQRSSSAAGH
jgi:hypothetical protein